MKLNSKFMVERDGAKFELDSQLVHFSSYLCFNYDNSEVEVNLLKLISKKLSKLEKLCIVGDKEFYNYIANHSDPSFNKIKFYTINNFLAKKHIKEFKHIFIAELTYFEKQRIKGLLSAKHTLLTVDDLIVQDKELLPKHAWVSIERNVYPLDLPELEFSKQKDLILIDCPSRNLSMMPNGLGYIHNAIKKAEINFETVDLDIHAYHRYHMHRIFDLGGEVILPNGVQAPTDPWLAENYDFWTLNSEHATVRESPPELLSLFEPFINEAAEKIIKAKPKILAMSIQQCNEGISRKLLSLIKKKLPNLIVISGGYSCYNPDIGLKAFPEVDYMFIGEAELTVGPVVKKIINNEKPANQAGVISKYDDPSIDFIPGPMPHNLDSIEFPKYEWFDNLDLYTNYNGYQLTPIIASRGCRWSRCTFCAERFYWRIRSPENFVDELEWFVSKGCYLFMFNESDLNGMPEKVIEICDEIIRRGLHKKVKLTGQLRVHKKSTKEFYEKLAAANFVALRFGVDAFSANTLKLQKKGYTVEMLSQNLKDCWEAGIFTEVNWVIGIPGETEQDVDEGIELIIKNKDYIGRLSNINPLILVNGGVYWLDPEAHDIHFRKNQEELYAKYPRGIPASLWYSEKPYIDGNIRKKRFEKIVTSLVEADVAIGHWAAKVISDIKENKDSMRDEQTTLQESKVKVTSLLDIEKSKNSKKIIQLIDINKANNDVTEAVSENELAYLDREGSYDILFYQDWYYAVLDDGKDKTKQIYNKDKKDVLKLLHKESTLKSTEIEDLKRLIIDISLWANSRGMIYTNSRELQKKNSTYYKAGSFTGIKKDLQKLNFDFDIIDYKNAQYAIPKEPKLKKKSKSRTEENQKIIDSKREIIPGNSLPRKILRLLPRKTQLYIKQTIKGMIIDVQGAADNKIIILLAKSLLSIIKKLFKVKKDVGMKYKDFSINGVVDKNASPEFLWSSNNYNFVKYNLNFYMVPHGMPVDWDTGMVDQHEDIIHEKSLQKLSQKYISIHGRDENELKMVNPKNEYNKSSGPFDKSNKNPIIIKSLNDFRIVSYEGWVYGIPKKYKNTKIENLDLLAKDIIRDVSEDVVEDQIKEIA